MHKQTWGQQGGVPVNTGEEEAAGGRKAEEEGKGGRAGPAAHY